MHEPTGAQRIHSLDVLRAAAIALVLVSHLPDCVPTIPAPMLLGFGRIGVDLFFVLSGFLIGYQVFHRPGPQGRGAALREFWLRRGFRTLPAYLAVLAFYLAGKSLLVDEGFAGDRWPYFFFLQNYADMVDFKHSWSLCIEEQFYLLLPVLVFLFGFRKLPAWAWLLPMGVGMLSRAVLVPESPMSDELLFDRLVIYPTHRHLDGLAAGLFLARTWPVWSAWAVSRRRLLVLPGFGAIAAAWLLEATGTWTPALVAGFTLLAAGFALLLVGSYGWTPPRGILVPAGALALWSYSAYLWHIPVYQAVTRSGLATGFWPVDALLLMGLVVVMAFLSYRTVERPFLDLRARVLVRRRPVAVPIPLPVPIPGRLSALAGAPEEERRAA